MMRQCKGVPSTASMRAVWRCLLWNSLPQKPLMNGSQKSLQKTPYTIRRRLKSTHASRHLGGQEAQPNFVDLGTLVSQASVRLPAALPPLPWETGCMRFIFGDFELPTFTLDAPMPDSAPAASASASVPLPEIPNREGPTFKPFEIKKSKDLDYHEARERQREHAIDKWLIVLRRVCAGKAEFHDRDTVKALLGTRAPSTACKRANACLRLLRWADSVGSSKVLEEAVIWRYLKSLEEGDGSGQGDEVLSSLRFMCHVLGVHEAGGLVSRRCVGLAEVMTSRKTFPTKPIR